MKGFSGAVLAFCGVILSVVLAVGGFLAFDRLAGPSAHQPIAYNHKVHLAQGLECGMCHTGIAEGKPRAGLPTVEICASCHNQDDTTPRAQLVREYVAASRPIAWQRVYRVPSHVLFSHRRHVGVGKLDCALCHGDMTKVEKPVTRPAVKITMRRCVACHESRKVTADCMACHR